MSWWGGAALVAPLLTFVLALLPPDFAAAQPAPETPAPVAPPDYRLGPEDVLEVAVWKEEGLRKDVLVRPDGMISFPLVGEVRAAGRTASEVQAEVSERLKRFLSSPVVSVTVTRVAAQKIYVIGRVAKPGEFSSGRYIDVLQALSMAGGLTPFASPNDIRVMRREGGRQVALPFRYDDVVRGRNVDQNVILKPGDVVVVP
jgi:polysaccharide export outer membrane protein